MCGIVGAVSTRNIVPVLVQGLERLEYRGYDSCGVAVYALDGQPAELALEGVSAALLRVVIQPLLASGYGLALGGQAATLTGPRDNYWGTWADQNYSWEEAILLEWWGQ